MREATRAISTVVTSATSELWGAAIVPVFASAQIARRHSFTMRHETHRTTIHVNGAALHAD